MADDDVADDDVKNREVTMVEREADIAFGVDADWCFFTVTVNAYKHVDGDSYVLGCTNLMDMVRNCIELNQTRGSFSLIGESRTQVLALRAELAACIAFIDSALARPRDGREEET